MTDRYPYNPPSVTPDEAVKLCVHHLRMAAALFEVVPEDQNKQLLNEILIQCADSSEVYNPAVAWANAILEEYSWMDEQTMREKS